MESLTGGLREVRKLDRLRQELNETESLLQSPRLSSTTRYVLERLRDDLKQQILSAAGSQSSGDNDP